MTLSKKPRRDCKRQMAPKSREKQLWSDSPSQDLRRDRREIRESQDSIEMPKMREIMQASIQ